MSTVHVIPLADGIEHLIPGGLDGHGPGCEDCTRPWLVLEADEDADDETCPCGPTAEHVPAEGGSPDGWLVTHHSLDAREFAERASA